MKTPAELWEEGYCQDVLEDEFEKMEELAMEK